MLRTFGLLAAGPMSLAVVAASGFRIAALLQEAGAPQQAAGQGAAFAMFDRLAIHYRQRGPADGLAAFVQIIRSGNFRLLRRALLTPPETD